MASAETQNAGKFNLAIKNSWLKSARKICNFWLGYLAVFSSAKKIIYKVSNV